MVVRKTTCKPYIDFVDDYGFHCVALDQILSVS
jgi:hypothetical protein